MDRLEINVLTGETTVISLTNEEIAEIQNLPRSSISPNWESLYSSLLTGNLRLVFNSVTEQAIANPSIAVGLIHVNSAIVQVKVEQALADALNVLQLSGYMFPKEYKTLRNNEIAKLNFSDLVKLK